MNAEAKKAPFQVQKMPKGERNRTVRYEPSGFDCGIRTLPIYEIKDFEWVPITLLLRNKNLPSAYAEPWRSQCAVYAVRV